MTKIVLEIKIDKWLFNASLYGKMVSCKNNFAYFALIQLKYLQSCCWKIEESKICKVYKSTMSEGLNVEKMIGKKNCLR